MIYYNYRNYLNILFIAFISGCGIFDHQEIPKWYYSQNIKITDKDYEIIGFGDGSTFQEADTIARNEIAKQIQTFLKSKYSRDEKRILDNIKSGYNLTIKNKIIEETSVELDDIIQIKKEIKNDRVYVALKYIHLPTPQKIEYKLKSSGYRCNTINDSIFLSKTTLMKKLKILLNCEPHMGLIYKNNNWYVNIDKKLTRIPSYEFIDLWSITKDNSINIKSTKNVLKKGDIFQLQININKEGYLSLFNVYSTGQTVFLIKNQRIDGITKLIYPDLNKFQGLIADIPQNNDFSKDLYISTLCPDVKNFSRYEPIDNKYLASNNSYHFGYLLEDINGCQVASDIVDIKPN